MSHPLIAGHAHGAILSSYAETIQTSETFRMGRSTGADGRSILSASSVAESDYRIDVSWLAAAALEFDISPDLRDYVLAEVPIVEGDVPNRNMHAFLSSRLTRFSGKYGMQVFKTFVGKPTFQDHKHQNPKAAKGVIFDATFRRLNGRDFVFLMKGFDRTKDSYLADAVLTRKRPGHSMSATAAYFDCSICGHRWDTSWGKACLHAKGANIHAFRDDEFTGRYPGFGSVIQGQLCYGAPDDFTFFESSSVDDQAAWWAQQMQQMDLK